MTQAGGSALAVDKDVFAGNSTANLLIRQVRLEADDIVSIEIVDPSGGQLPSWGPGAHVDVFLESGLVRQYSLCGDATDRSRFRIAVLREKNGRGGSEEIHRSIRVGASIKIGRPRNLFHVPEVAAGYLCIAGGVGVTPILSIIRDARRRDVPVRIVYGGRTKESMAFVDEIRSLLPDTSIDLVPNDTRGMIELEREILDAPNGWAICACGPPTMLEALESVSTKLGARDRLYVERFSGSAGLEAQLLAAPNNPVSVHLERSGTTVEVGPDQSILDAVQDISPVISSCKEGYCGTCETVVLAGIPDHRDTVLTDEERDSNQIMMICVSRAKSGDLTLDL